MNLADKKVLIGLSGGINSMAVLCWLADYEFKPKELHLFYAHFEEHSPDTMDFVLAGLEFAKKNFQYVYYKQTNNSVIEFFRDQKMIPHPMISPCTRLLKIIPMSNYAIENGCEVDLIGYVKSETRRMKNMESKGANNLFFEKLFPIIDQENEWCFKIVKEKIGWYPKIYDIRDNIGSRVFKHNNCLPCKNWREKDYANGNKFFPEKMKPAIELQNELQAHFGRNENDIYTTFPKKDWETNEIGQTCDYCGFD